MAQFDITSPDGRKFRITAPEGATQDEVLAYAQSNMPAPTAPKPEVEDPGAIMSTVIAAGRTGDKLWEGAKQLGLSLPAALGHEGSQKRLGEMAAQQKAADEVYAPLAKKHPVATFVGEALPLVAMPMLGGGTVTGMAAGAALPGLVSYGSTEDRMKAGGMGAGGGALGAVVGKAIGAAAQPIRNAPTQSQQAAQAAAERLGVQLRPGEQTGSRALRWAESALNDLPFSGGMAQKAEQARTAAINRGAAKSIGQNATELTEDVLANARTQIGGTFDNLLANRKITLDNSFRNEVQAIGGSKVMKALRNEEVDAILGPFKNLPQGKVKVTGDWFQQNKTALDSAIRSSYLAGENGKARALEQFEKALERAAIRSMSADEAAAFKAAQKQWASLRLLETGKVVEGGNVLPGRLDSALTTRYGAAYKEGKIKGDLADIGKLAQVYKPLPQSGTAPRAVYSGMAGGALFAEPMTAASMMAGPPLAQKFLQINAGKNYLTRGLADITPEIERRLMLTGGGLLGVPAAAGANR